MRPIWLALVGSARSSKVADVLLSALGLGRLVEAKRSAEDVNSSKIQRLAVSLGPIIGAGRKERRDKELALI